MADETTWTDNTTQREMTLDEWMATLPESHRARRELTTLRARAERAEGAQRDMAERALRWAWRAEGYGRDEEERGVSDGLAALGFYGAPADDPEKPAPRALASRGPAAEEGCHAGKDGECNWGGCPQTRDNEPNNSGRFCPLPKEGEYEDR